MTVLIPAYKPDEKFLAFLDDLFTHTDYRVVVVDDGGGAAFDGIFAAAEQKGAEIIRYPVNKGKGVALKTGMAYIRSRHPNEQVVTADCDGQHTVSDINSVAGVLEGRKNALVLGCRDIKKMPARSKAGNTLTRFFFWLFSGHFLSETQTGVRGISPDRLELFAHLPGDRYEYEMNMLFGAVDNDVEILEAPISTTYIDNNSSTHFNDLRDGYLIYSLMVKNRAADIIGFLAGLATVLLLSLLFGKNVMLPHVLALMTVCGFSLKFLITYFYKTVKNGARPPRIRVQDVLFGFLAGCIIVGCIFGFVYLLLLPVRAALLLAVPAAWAIRLLFRDIKIRLRK